MPLLNRLVLDHDASTVEEVVAFGLLANVIVIMACFLTLEWVRTSSSKRDALSKRLQTPASTSIIHERRERESTYPAIFASKDLDTQNMLLSSANVNLFFHNPIKK